MATFSFFKSPESLSCFGDDLGPCTFFFFPVNISSQKWTFMCSHHHIFQPISRYSRILYPPASYYGWIVLLNPTLHLYTGSWQFSCLSPASWVLPSLLYCPINIETLYIFSHKKNFLNFTSHSRNPSYYSLFPSRKAPLKSAYSHNHHCLFSFFFFLSNWIVIPSPFTLPDLLLSRLPVTTGYQRNH